MRLTLVPAFAKEHDFESAGPAVARTMLEIGEEEGTGVRGRETSRGVEAGLVTGLRRRVRIPAPEENRGSVRTVTTAFRPAGSSVPQVAKLGSLASRVVSPAFSSHRHVLLRRPSRPVSDTVRLPRPYADGRTVRFVAYRPPTVAPAGASVDRYCNRSHETWLGSVSESSEPSQGWSAPWCPSRLKNELVPGSDEGIRPARPPGLLRCAEPISALTLGLAGPRGSYHTCAPLRVAPPGYDRATSFASPPPSPAPDFAGSAGSSSGSARSSEQRLSAAEIASSVG
jgi:hypothetical protein